MEITGDTTLLAEEFGVEYHPDYLGKFFRDLGLS
jgi:transposase